MDAAAQVETVIELLRQLGVSVRNERLGGDGGGLCHIRGETVMFIDSDADIVTTAERCVDALATIPGTGQLNMPDDLRELVSAAARSRGSR